MVISLQCAVCTVRYYAKLIGLLLLLNCHLLAPKQKESCSKVRNRKKFCREISLTKYVLTLFLESNNNADLRMKFCSFINLAGPVQEPPRTPDDFWTLEYILPQSWRTLEYDTSGQDVLQSTPHQGRTSSRVCRIPELQSTFYLSRCGLQSTCTSYLEYVVTVIPACANARFPNLLSDRVTTKSA